MPLSSHFIIILLKLSTYCLISLSFSIAFLAISLFRYNRFTFTQVGLLVIFGRLILGPPGVFVRVIWFLGDPKLRDTFYDGLVVGLVVYVISQLYVTPFPNPLKIGTGNPKEILGGTNCGFDLWPI